MNDYGLSQDLANIDFSPVYNLCNPNSSLEYFIKSLQTAIINNTTRVSLSKRHKIIKPWMTPGLLRCIRNRDKLHKKSNHIPSNEILKRTYTRYRNFCNAILKKVKRTYEKNLLQNAKQDNKKLWRAIKDITNTSQKHLDSKELLTLSTSPEESLNKVNSYFINVGSSLANNIYQKNLHTLNMNFQNNHTDTTVCKSFALLDTSESEVERLIETLKTDCASGWGLISNKILKAHKNIFVSPLTKIFNDCLQLGVFPDSLKKAVVCPIFKAGDRNRVENYRPISILPSISKILERIINVRLVKYLEGNSLLSTNQYGFRRDQSTDLAVNKLTDYITSNLDNGKKCLTIFLDLAKAFDTISVSILLDKLERLGVRGMQLKLFRSYLTGRLQCVRVGSHKSGNLEVSHGVPQGSILGPTLFLVYINELTSLRLSKGIIISFADDTALSFSANTWNEVFVAAQAGFGAVGDWLDRNILTLNVDKTKYICFSIKGVKENFNNRKIVSHQCQSGCNCSCPTVERVHAIKYLGVIMDSNLNFKEHIKVMCGRVRKLIYVFKNLRHVADPGLLKQIYYSLCQSLLTYCISTWGGALKTVMKPIEIAQRAILKVCSFQPIFFPTTMLYQIAGVLTVRQLFILSACLLQHRKQTFDPQLLEKRRKNIVCPRLATCKTKFAQRFANFIAPFIYNRINRAINIYPLTKVLLKKQVCEYLLKLNYEETELLLYIAK
ncbi:unnamed protein product [Arctia plantaginis]|uniref:Reverse transcriptase domain-containing protein n=1 Tax=Arctia plantaginis TaxID=874455 RepID=A0A8S0ZRR5_ARCPL|nr:unnamed protein product [Arctia plantaginis]